MWHQPWLGALICRLRHVGGGLDFLYGKGYLTHEERGSTLLGELGGVPGMGYVGGLLFTPCEVGVV